ncbi:MAG: class I SAM-dependent methyltransferase [Candidatus Parcubacteria bacterium]|nr:class I SAM-dependent methyltransferase [Candidatus Parcubacteria bacterium]
MGEINNFIDIRAVTYEERIKIGFDNLRGIWKSAQANFTDNTLKICGHPVMESWEDNYMGKLAEIATANGGTILEVGFGLGISASYIQKQKINKHIIIEANQEVYNKALEFASQAQSSVEIILGFWEDTINKLADESLDGILFDTYPLEVDDIHCNHFDFFKEAQRLLRSGGILTYYSDEIIDFSPRHVACLNKAGFSNIQGKICSVNPPAGCQYWQSNTILAPIIIK